jgi:hypothetical protein
MGEEPISSKLYSKVLGPYVNDRGRQIVVVRDGEKWRTISYPKYKLEEHLGRRLDPDQETVDHIDSNFNNNDINNLEIVPRAEHSRQDVVRVRLIELRCDGCGSKIFRSPRLLRLKSKLGKTGIFCSRRCSGRYGRQLALGLIQPLPIQPYTESEYYKQKYEEDEKPLLSTPTEEILLTVD